jgi:hypothetical protein
MKGMLALPEDPNQNAAARQGLLTAGAALLGGRGNLGEILGGGLLAGSQGYQGGLAQQQQQQYRQSQLEQTNLENKRLQAAADEPMQLQRILSGGQSTPMGPPASLPRLGGAPAAGASFGAAPAPGSIAPQAPADQYATLMGYAERLTQAGRVAQAKPYYDMAEKLRPKLMKQEARMVDGQRVMANVFEDGRTERVDGFAPDAEKLSFQNTGGSTVALDPFTGKPVNTIGNTVSPDARLSADTSIRNSNVAASTARRSQDMTDARSREQIGQTKTPAGYRWSADKKSLEPIPGGPATKSAMSTEGERKAGTLLMRLQGSEEQLQEALKDDPGAAKPGIVAQGLRTIGAEALANTAAVSEARQRVEAAQLDILDSALTLGTGAAYTREQLEGYRKSYFPQIGDGPKTIIEKQDRLRNVKEAAKIAAGRSAPAAVAAIVHPTRSVKDLPKKAAVPDDIGNLLNKYGAK